jgi:hypothetical protein
VKGTEGAVGGVVVARHGVSTVDVINRVTGRIQALQMPHRDGEPERHGGLLAGPARPGGSDWRHLVQAVGARS